VERYSKISGLVSRRCKVYKKHQASRSINSTLLQAHPHPGSHPTPNLSYGGAGACEREHEHSTPEVQLELYLMLDIGLELDAELRLGLSTGFGIGLDTTVRLGAVGSRLSWGVVTGKQEWFIVPAFAPRAH
jgi:hypothetical protein